MTHSLSFRFNLFAVSIITLILSLFGAYNYYDTSKSVNERMDVAISVLLDSLGETLPDLIWNYETEGLERSLNSAIKNSNITGILLYEGENPTAGFYRDDNGDFVANTDLDLLGSATVSSVLQFTDDLGASQDVGKLVVAKNIGFVEEQKQKAVIDAILKIVILGLLVSLSITALLAKLVKAPLNKITNALHDISEGEGDLTQRLEIERDDEVGQLARYFNDFVEKIHLAMRQVESSTAEMNQTVEIVNLNAQENTTAVERAKLETDSVATAITQMNASAHDVANNALEASQSAKIADVETKKAQEVVQETSDAIRSLASEIEEGANVMTSLKSDVNSIVSVLDTIRGIAEQTNLLALNAAIEAARAGDQGRGFAVVADEVRALAARTQESTSQIQSTIEKLEGGSDHAVDVMHRSTERSSETVERVAKAIESLNNIADSMSNINNMSAQIAAAVSEQTNVSEEINTNVSSIASVIQDTSDGAHLTSEASLSLAENSAQLGQMVGQFQL